MGADLIELDARENHNIIDEIITNLGNSAEHNYYNYIYNCDKDEIPLFYKFDNCGIMTFYCEKTQSFRIFSAILSDGNALDVLSSFLEYAKTKAKKVEIETTEEMREEIIRTFKDVYDIRKVVNVFNWPVFDMKAWSGDRMEGKAWKDLRYYWHRYFREHKIEFVTAESIDKDILLDLVMKWKDQRTGKRQTFYRCYLNAVENGLKGFCTRIMKVDGRVVAMTAGFKVPKNNYYYSAIGIYSRDIPRTGEISNMDDLFELKKNGYEYVDFGGSEDDLLAFKMKFHPSYIYKTVVFNIGL